MLDEKIYSKYFKAFGDPTRLRILALLSRMELTVNEIVAKIGLSQPTISRHLGILKEAEVVIGRREGQQVFYSLHKKEVSNCCSSFCMCLDIKETRHKKKNSQNCFFLEQIYVYSHIYIYTYITR